MSQFDLYINIDTDSKTAYPYFVDVQNELLDTLNSRLVIPLTKLTDRSQVFPSGLCPVITVEEQELVLLTHQMTSVPITFLKHKYGSIVEFRTEIISAIDFLITGI
jgi:toxin CcdB